MQFLQFHIFCTRSGLLVSVDAGCRKIVTFLTCLGVNCYSVFLLSKDTNCQLLQVTSKEFVCILGALLLCIGRSIFEQSKVISNLVTVN